MFNRVLLFSVPRASVIMTVSFLMAVSLTYAATPDGAGVEFHSSVAEETRKTLDEDFNLLVKMDRKFPDAEKSVFKFKRLGPEPTQDTRTEGEKLKQWFSERVHYLVWESYDLEKNSFSSKVNYHFPAAPAGTTFSERRYFPVHIETMVRGTFNRVLGEAIDKIKEKMKDKLSEDPKDIRSAENTPRKSALSANVIAQNLSGFYQAGRGMGHAIGFLWDNGTVIDYTSTRTGFIQIGGKMFSNRMAVYSNLGKSTDEALGASSLAFNSVYRLMTVLHEARHSDGNGVNVSFGHSLCPLGHAMEMEYACDYPSNGPYTVGLQFVEFARQNEAMIIQHFEELLDAQLPQGREVSSIEQDSDELHTALQVLSAEEESRLPFKHDYYGREVLKGSTTEKDFLLEYKRLFADLKERVGLYKTAPDSYRGEENLRQLGFSTEDFRPLEAALGNSPAKHIRSVEASDLPESVSGDGAPIRPATKI